MNRTNVAGRSLNFSYSFRRARITGNGGLENGYSPLFDVSIRHSYYNSASDGTLALCPDFDVVPTPDCIETMQSFRMIFKNRGTGWTVYILDSMLPALATYVADNAIRGKNGLEYWSRLTFLLVPANPLFVGITELPIDTSPLRDNFYLSNRTAHLTDAGVVLCERDAVDASTLRGITGEEFTVTIPLGTQFVVRDIAGQKVLTISGDQPDPPASSNAVISVTPDGEKVVLVDLGGLPYDFYTLECENAAGQPVPDTGFPEEVIYVPTRPQPLGLVDLLFMAPTADSDGIYPLPRPELMSDDPAGSQAASDEPYLLPFRARKTYWYYYIVSQRPISHFSNLRIDGDDVRFIREPDPVRLPTGDVAVCFRSDETLTLRRYPTERFRLKGRRKGIGTVSNEVEVYPLPTAPNQPVWPGDTPGSCISQIYVYV